MLSTPLLHPFVMVDCKHLRHYAYVNHAIRWVFAFYENSFWLIVVSILFQSNSKTNAMVLSELIVNAVYGFGVIFIACELCQRGCDGFNELDYLIGQFDWYLFPQRINRLMPTIIFMAQEKLGFRCFGSILCDRDTFKEVRIRFLPTFKAPLITSILSR